MDVEEPLEPPAEEKPKRRRRRTVTSEPKRTSRFERRAEKATGTLGELIKLRRPDLDVSGLSFLEVVDRDKKAWGQFIAQLGEWFVPLGQLVDLVFGAPLLILLGLAPSVRAARRDLAERRELKAKQREQERLDAENAREGEPEYLPQQ